MDLFTLDSQIRRTALYDRYQSLIWTERFAAYGDFELKIHSSSDAKIAFQPGTRLALNESTRVMVCETMEDTIDTEGRTLLTVKGSSLEKLLTDRTTKTNMNGSNSDPGFAFPGGELPATIARYLFNWVVRSGGLSAADRIPFLVDGTGYPAGNIPEPIAPVVMTIPPGILYEEIKKICDVYGLGFRLYRNGDLSQLYFDVYTGNDRTTQQTYLPAVIFSPDLDNLQDVSFLTSTASYKNVALVESPNGALYVYGASVSESISGLERKVLYVDASDITDAAGTVLNSKLAQRGREKLSEHMNLAAFDGQISNNSQYRYHEHYELGDLVEIRNSDKVTNQMVVTEQIFVSDAEGDRQYPTLALKLLIDPGSWYSLPPLQVWDELTNVADTWATRP
jgi:hypothetical protein